MKGSSSRMSARHCFMARRKSCTASWLDRSGSVNARRALARMLPAIARSAGPIAALGFNAGVSSGADSIRACMAGSKIEAWKVKGRKGSKVEIWLLYYGEICGLRTSLLGGCLLHDPSQNQAFAAGWSSPVARQAHNLKVVGSNPTPATTFTLIPKAFLGSLWTAGRKSSRAATNWQPRGPMLHALPLDRGADTHSDTQSPNPADDRKRISALPGWGGVTINL